MPEERMSRSDWDRPRPVGQVLSDLLKASGLTDSLADSALRTAWLQTTGGEVSKHTRVVGVRNGILTVEVDSAPWLHELSAFYKGSILSDIRRLLPKQQINDIKFRAGSF
jgi:predicted nucleic acid-binding Zn ribbon protein